MDDKMNINMNIKCKTLSGILIEKSTIPQIDIELDFSVSSQTIIINNNGMYDSLDDI